MTVQQHKPQIYDYVDHRRFLADVFAWKKTLGFFSYQTFAEKAGLKSRGYLRLVISGKRNITLKSIDCFVRGLDLSSREAEAFKTLVQSNLAPTLDLQQRHWEAFLRLRPKSHTQSRIQDIYLYLARRSYPVLLSLLRQTDICQDTAALAAMAGVTPSEVEEALGVFQKLGFISRAAETAQIRVQSASYYSSDDVPNMAIQSFHRNMASRTGEALELSVDEREFQSVILSLSHAQFLELKKRIRAWAEETDSAFSSTQPSGAEAVYALNLNLIPISSKLIRPRSTRAEETRPEPEPEQPLPSQGENANELDQG